MKGWNVSFKNSCENEFLILIEVIVMRKILAGRVYRHFKGKDYKVLVVAQHTETGEQCVVYQALYDDFAYYVRPYAMFASEVDRDKYPEVEQQYRFELTEEEYD